MEVLAVNPTDRDGAIVGADLHLTYTLKSGTAIVVKIPHARDVDAMPEEVKPFDIPIPLPANGAVAGWLVFKIDDGIVGEGAIQRYDVVLRDSRGPEETVQPWALREVASDAKT